MNKLIYPACFYPAEDGGYTVIVPDLPGCISEGDTLAEALEMATDAASGWILDELESGKPVPPPQNIKDIRLSHPESFVNLVILDMESYADKYGSKAVRKNLTIPAWLNTFAESQHLNFSKILQESLIKIYQEQRN